MPSFVSGEKGVSGKAPLRALPFGEELIAPLLSWNEGWKAFAGGVCWNRKSSLGSNIIAYQRWASCSKALTDDLRTLESKIPLNFISYS